MSTGNHVEGRRRYKMSRGNHVEAWKAVIDFSKVVLAFSSALTAAVIGYYLTNNVRPSFISLVPVTLLVLSAVLSLFGFGRGIVAVKTGKTSKSGLAFCNFAAVALFVGVLLVFFIRPETNKSFPSAFNETLSQLKQVNFTVDLRFLKQCTYESGKLTITFDVNKGVKEVIYDQKTKEISNVVIAPQN